MRFSTDQVQDDRSTARLAIVRTLLVQILVMLAISGVGTFYLKWSSDAAVREFMDAGNPTAPDVKHHPQVSSPVQTVQHHGFCTRRA